MFTDGSVKKGVKSGWAYSAKIDGFVVAEDSGAFTQTTSLLLCHCAWTLGGP